jgi:hypothetical protein
MSYPFVHYSTAPYPRSEFHSYVEVLWPLLDAIVVN